MGRTLKIYADSKGMGRCRSCGADIEWAELTSGKRMPFNPPIVATLTQGDLLRDDRVIEVIDTDITPVHFQTCPQADDWRRK